MLDKCDEFNMAFGSYVLEIKGANMKYFFFHQKKKLSFKINSFNCVIYKNILKICTKKLDHFNQNLNGTIVYIDCDL